MLHTIPSMRINVTSKCNMSCYYCPGRGIGDNFNIPNGRPNISLDLYKNIIIASHRAGVRNFTITGGEPLVEIEKTIELMEYITALRDVNYLKIATNGLWLGRYATAILDKVRSGMVLSQIKASIDTLNKVKYEESTGIDGLGVTLDGLRTFKNNGIGVRINMVVDKDNFCEVVDMVEYCNANCYDIKIFDLNLYNMQDADRYCATKANYVALDSLVDELCRNFKFKEIIYLTGGYGTPMKVFYNKNMKNTIIVRESKLSEGRQQFISGCRSCIAFPCSEGVSSMYLTVDGRLKFDRLEGIECEESDFGQIVTVSEAEERIRYIIDEHFKSSKIITEL